MVDDFLEFLDYYSQTPDTPVALYDDPLIRIEYDEVTKDGRAGIALLTPYAHAINALCYREIDCESYYNQKVISEICRVSPAEVTGWKKEVRIPEKYRWFLLLVDISYRAENIYSERIIHPSKKEDAEKICNIYLRMIKSSYEPFCIDDKILMEAVWFGKGINVAKRYLLEANSEQWKKIFVNK